MIREDRAEWAQYWISEREEEQAEEWIVPLRRGALKPLKMHFLHEAVSYVLGHCIGVVPRNLRYIKAGLENEADV